MVTPGNQRIACTGATQSYAFPASSPMRGKFLYVRAIGVEIQCAVAKSAQALTLDQVSNAAAGTSSAGAGMTLYAGEFFDKVLIDSAITHFVWISRTAAGFVEFYVSEG
jgi:hypothetical protein